MAKRSFPSPSYHFPRLYEKALYKLMAQKQSYINNVQDYSSKIFSLKKIIAINKRAGNSYAVKRDEVQIDAYLIAKHINYNETW
ncbi:MAG: hypothetical protein FAF04_05270 [Epsilonproteobacteria bacterium]|nr:hypothetical protein [Campylobacterota bacterium]